MWRSAAKRFPTRPRDKLYSTGIVGTIELIALARIAPGSRLVVRNGRKVVIYRPDGRLVWATSASERGSRNERFGSGCRQCDLAIDRVNRLPLFAPLAILSLLIIGSVMNWDRRFLSLP